MSSSPVLRHTGRSESHLAGDSRSRRTCFCVCSFSLAGRGADHLFAFVAVAAFCCFVFATGCSRFAPKPPDQYVYVTARQAYLRDRVAAVSNRTGTVENGQRLVVLEHGRRFLRVRAEGGEIGWIDEKAVATQQIDDAFAALQRQHANDPAVASAVARDEVYLHLAPGRMTERFYRLAEGDKLSLLERAALPRGGGPNPNAKALSARNPKQAAIPGAASGMKPVGSPTPPAPQSALKSATALAAGEPPAPPPIAPPPMEDWWLVRDSHGHVGWMLSRLLEVDVPDSVARYSEGQRIVGAYVLSRVYDPDAPQAQVASQVASQIASQAPPPQVASQDDKNVPEYVTVLSPYKAGLPYDFDQVRVFTWNVKMHRYETAFREKNIEGYLPVEIKMLRDPGGRAAGAATPLPGFTYKVLPADAAPVIPDPETGAIVPGPTIAKTYRLEGNILHRMLPPGEKPPDEAHPEIEPDKKDKKDKKKTKGP